MSQLYHIFAENVITKERVQLTTHAMSKAQSDYMAGLFSTHSARIIRVLPLPTVIHFEESK